MTLFLQFSRQLVLVHVGVLDQLLLIAVALAYAGDGRQPHQMALSVLVTGDEMDLVTPEGLVYQGKKSWKRVFLEEKGMEKAKSLLEKYGIADWQ